MKSGLKHLRLDYVIQSLSMIAVGALFIFWPEASITFIAKALGVLILVVGLVFFGAYFFKKEKLVTDPWKSAFGLLIAVIGGWIFLVPGPLTEFVPTMFGVFVLIIGLVHLVHCRYLTIYMLFKLWWVSVVFAVITILIGLYIITNPNAANIITIKLIGGILIFTGVTNLWTSFCAIKAGKLQDEYEDSKMSYSDPDGEYIEGEYTEIDEDEDDNKK
ncbi:MAG: hypothetical protein E7307_09480 [Butyrivibrio sp.]|nr:hypothetical protein [Butyrivibrio sp.]